MRTAEVAGATGDTTRAASSLLPALPPAQRITASCAALPLIIQRLETTITPLPSRAPLTHFTPSSRSSLPNRPPWHPPSAYAIFDVAAALARTYILLGGHPLAAPAGPLSSAFFLQRIPARAAASDNNNDRALLEAARLLDRAVTRSLTALGDVEAWSPLPRLPGFGPPICPHSCHLPSLRMRPLQGHVRCVTPSCTDSQRFPRPSGQLYPHRAPATGTWSWHLIWKDGTEGVLPGHPTRRKQEEIKIKEEVAA